MQFIDARAASDYAGIKLPIGGVFTSLWAGD